MCGGVLIDGEKNQAYFPQLPLAIFLATVKKCGLMALAVIGQLSLGLGDKSLNGATVVLGRVLLFPHDGDTLGWLHWG